MHLIPSIAIAIAIAITIALALAGTAQAATPDAEAAMPTRASVEAAMLECHTWYADRYATRVDAAPSEIAAGSFAACGQQMDAFAARPPALAQQESHCATGAGDASASEHRRLARIRKQVRNTPID